MMQKQNQPRRLSKQRNSGTSDLGAQTAQSKSKAISQTRLTRNTDVTALPHLIIENKKI
jgi:hypothetical protein